MQHRVLCFFKGEEKKSPLLIGHYDLKSHARLAIHEDMLKHKDVVDLEYKIDEVEEILTQEQIDLIFKT